MNKWYLVTIDLDGKFEVTYTVFKENCFEAEIAAENMFWGELKNLPVGIQVEQVNDQI
jgi:hypothetical protein